MEDADTGIGLEPKYTEVSGNFHWGQLTADQGLVLIWGSRILIEGAEMLGLKFISGESSSSIYYSNKE